MKLKYKTKTIKLHPNSNFSSMNDDDGDVFCRGGACRGVAEPNLLSDVSSVSAAGPDPIVLASAKMMIMSRMIPIVEEQDEIYKTAQK